MLGSISRMTGFTIQALDGQIGSIDDFYFDDEKWTIRYLVINTGSWLVGRRVLISPVSVRTIDRAKKTISVHLTMSQIEASPDVDTEKPVSRQQEEQLNQHYGWPAYWNFGTYMGPPGFGTGVFYPGTPYPQAIEAPREPSAPTATERRNAALRSLLEVLDYHIEAGHGRIGHVDDMIVDDEDWTIRYLVVDTRDWLPGKKVLIAPLWVNRINWTTGSFVMDVDRQTIADAPAYDPSRPITEEDEKRLSDYYCKIGAGEPVGAGR